MKSSSPIIPFEFANSGAAGARLGSATDRGCRRRRHRDIGSGEELGFLSWDPELTCFFEPGSLSSGH